MTRFLRRGLRIDRDTVVFIVMIPFITLVFISLIPVILISEYIDMLEKIWKRRND